MNYTEWRKFDSVIKKAILSCNGSTYKVSDHFVSADKMIKIAKGGQRQVNDYKLSRYACYLIAQNADSRKKVVALAQTYFAIQTRKMELAARDAGVKNFDKFHNAGYRGLYNGESACDIAKRKGLRYREDILDNMGSEELADNLFRIVQTESKLKKDNVTGENNASDVHYEIGSKIRKTIKELGGTMPEDLPTPNKSLKELEKENKEELININKKINIMEGLENEQRNNRRNSGIYSVYAKR